MVILITLSVLFPYQLDLNCSCIKRSSFSCPDIQIFIWIEPLLRGHMSYKATFWLSQRWPLNTEGRYFKIWEGWGNRNTMRSSCGHQRDLVHISWWTNDCISENMFLLFSESYCCILILERLSSSPGWPKEEGQTTQWPKEKEQKDKQRATKHFT
jgi:hypothetical protein